MHFIKRLTILSSALGVVAASGSAALAQKRYDVGVNTVPYSGPASIYGIIGRAEAAYFKQATNLKDFRSDVLLPGIKINTGPSDFAPISQLQLMKFKGERWELFGEVISGVGN